MSRFDFSTLKAGDKVPVESGGFSRDVSIETIDRLTKTQIIIRHVNGFDIKYRRDGGRKVGGGAYTAGRLLEPSSENMDRARLLVLKSQLAFKMTLLERKKDLSADQMRELIKVIGRAIGDSK